MPQIPRPTNLSTESINKSVETAVRLGDYSTAMSRLVPQPRALLTPEKIEILLKMHPHAIHNNDHLPSKPPPTLLPFHLDTLQLTMQKSPRGKAPGYLADSPDLLLAIADRTTPGCTTETGNTLLQHLMSLYPRGYLHSTCWHIMRDNYLMALYKDYINKPQKLRPLGIGTALRSLMDRHITKVFAGAMAKHLFPFQFAIGIKGGIDFLLQTSISVLPSKLCLIPSQERLLEKTMSLTFLI
jgi:hypothetical protein